MTDDSTLTNPFAYASATMAHSPTHSSSSSDSGEHHDTASPHDQPAAASVVQTVNICNNIPVVLNYTTANYSQWC
jgi:hypothetical protein